MVDTLVFPRMLSYAGTCYGSHSDSPASVLSFRSSRLLLSFGLSKVFLDAVEDDGPRSYQRYI